MFISSEFPGFSIFHSYLLVDLLRTLDFILVFISLQLLYVPVIVEPFSVYSWDVNVIVCLVLDLYLYLIENWIISCSIPFKTFLCGTGHIPLTLNLVFLPMTLLNVKVLVVWSLVSISVFKVFKSEDFTCKFVACVLIANFVVSEPE